MLSPILGFGEAGNSIHPAMIIGLVSVASASIGKITDYGMEQVLSVRHTASKGQGYLIIGKPLTLKLVVVVTIVVVLLSFSV